MQVKEGEPRWNGSSIAAAMARLSTERITPAIAGRRNLPTILLHGTRFHAIDEQKCIEHILSEIEAGRGGYVVTPNIDHLARAGQDVSFAALVADANLVVADGMPLVWASRLQGTPLPQRVAGSDLISSLSAAAAGQGKSIFLLGGDSGTAEAAATILRDRYPQLKIAGKLCPEIGFEKDEAEIQRITFELQTAKPDIVFVALGSPKQERLIDRLRGALPATWWLGVGVSFSFLCGNVRRAPVWMRNCGLEWTHRLVQEPKRLFKRYIIVGIPFAGWLLARAAVRGVGNRLLGHVDGEGGGDSTESIGLDESEDFSTRQSADEAVESMSDLTVHRANGNPSPDGSDDGAVQFDAIPPILPNRGRLRGLVLLGEGSDQLRWRPPSAAASWICRWARGRRFWGVGWMRPRAFRACSGLNIFLSGY